MWKEFHSRYVLNRNRGLKPSIWYRVNGSDGSKRMLTNFWANTVLSLSGKCSSSANTTQLAMIVNNTAYSKGGHSMMNRVYFLIGLSSVRINNDVGPPPGGFSSFFGPPILSAKRWAPFRPKCPPPKESCWCPASTASWAASNLIDTRDSSKSRIYRMYTYIDINNIFSFDRFTSTTFSYKLVRLVWGI